MNFIQIELDFEILNERLFDAFFRRCPKSFGLKGLLNLTNFDPSNSSLSENIRFQVKAPPKKASKLFLR